MVTAATVHLTHPVPVPPAGTCWTDEKALETACGHLRLTVEREILDGGSAARVYLARGDDDERFAVKVLVARPGRVDGHDLDAFLGKLTQLNWIRAADPALGRQYLPVTHAIHGRGWAAYTTPFYESVDCAALLRAPAGGPGAVGESAFFDLHSGIVTDLVVHGYGQAIVAARPDWLATVLAGRIPRRAPMLHRHLPAEVVLADELVVNGVPCVSPLRLVQRLVETAPPWWQRLAPARLMFPAHGDANTRNILVGAGSTDHRLIDPRGSTAYWDPVYDLAKTLFSLTVRDPALRLGCFVRTVDGRPDRWEVGFRRPTFPGYRLAAHGFLPHLDGLADLAGLLHGDRYWRERLLLTHDLHVLAEAACRLSDPKLRPGPDGVTCPAELALGHFLLGALLLNDLVAQLAVGEVDVDGHLRLVTGRLPAL